MTKQKITLPRCEWVTSDPLDVHYHDEEWGVPVYDDQRLFEFLLLEGAQAGLSWLTILKKRENYRLCFDGFDPCKIAHYNQRKIESLLCNASIIRNRLKIAAAIENSQSLFEDKRSARSF